VAPPAAPAKGRVRARQGASTFRVLSYYFELEWDWRGVGEYVTHVLGQFEVPPDPNENRNPPTPGFPSRYRLVDGGRGVDARYRLEYSGSTMLRSNNAGDVLFHLFWHVNSETVRRTGDFLLIHAGAVCTRGGQGVVLPGASGAGKTTLVAGLVAAGFHYLSDEAAAIDPVARRLYPYPKAMTIKRQLAELFPGVRIPGARSGWVDGQVHLRPEDIRPDSVGWACDVGLIVTPRYVEGAATEVVPMTPAEAAVELGRNALNLSLYGSRALPALADVVRHARCFRMVSGDLSEAVAAVTRLARRAP
jgi:hypothetical protein